MKAGGAQLSQLNTPVLFLVFNRPDTTTQVFEAIRKVSPSRLYVAADGPRFNRLNEAECVTLVRKIVTSIDWTCKVRTLFREHNLGCKIAVSEAISWFFEHEEAGIILEDDCLPHSDFFYFCEKLLPFYKDNNQIFVITGNNFQNGNRRGDGSYYFSKYNHCWGWATWRRAWRHYQGGILFWPEWKQSEGWRAICPDQVERRYWEKIFDKVYANGIDSWAYPWTASVWRYGGLTVTPNVNLVSNIGFGQDATHTVDSGALQANLPTEALPKVVHPNSMVQDQVADRYVFDHNFGGRRQRWPWNWLHFSFRAVRWLKRRALSDG